MRLRLMLVVMMMPVLLMLMSVVMVMILVTVRVLMLMLMLFFILVMRVHRAGMNAKMDAFDLPLLPAFEVHVEIAKVELSQFPLERGRIDAQVAQRADSHVAANARRTIKEENAQRGKG